MLRKPMARTDFWQYVLHPTDVIEYPSRVVGFRVPGGAQADRPVSPPEGTLYRNDDTNIIDVYVNGSWEILPTTNYIGEINVGQSVGSGYSIYDGKSGVDLQFKSLVGGPNVNIADNGDELEISADLLVPIVYQNIGTGDGDIYSGVSGSTHQLREIVSNNGDLTITNNGDIIEFDADIPPAGETNTASNSGAGAALFKQKTGVDLEFRSLLSADPSLLTITENTDEIEFSFTTDPVFTGSSHIRVPTGTTGNRPNVPNTGHFRLNSITSQAEYYDGSGWSQLYDVMAEVAMTSGSTMTGDIEFTSGSSLIINDNGNLSTDGNILISDGNLVDGQDISMNGDCVDVINDTIDVVFKIDALPIDDFMPIEDMSNPVVPLTFTRPSSAPYTDRRGNSAIAVADEIRLNYDANNTLEGWFLENNDVLMANAGDLNVGVSDYYTACGEIVMHDASVSHNQVALSIHSAASMGLPELSVFADYTNGGVTVRIQPNIFVSNYILSQNVDMSFKTYRFCVVNSGGFTSFTLAIDGVDLGNGAGVAKTYPPIGATTTRDTIQIGNNYAGDSPLDGSVRRIWFYNHGLSQEQAESLCSFL